MRIATLLLAVTTVCLPACDAFEFEGDPAAGAFPASAFSSPDQTRSELVAVESACDSYCAVADGCGALSGGVDDCVADCIEPKLVAMQSEPEAVADCTSEYSATMACAMEPVCEDFGACDDAVDAYVQCARSL